MTEVSKNQKRRPATVFDAVAGRLGPNGFLTSEQLASSAKPHGPEEILMMRLNAPDDVPPNFYEADAHLATDQATLPASDLLKAVHAYASDFYSMATTDNGERDFKSLDETALLAMGVLLEEAALEILGETGDMTLVEPEGLENGLPETKMTRYQIKGRVNPSLTPEDDSETGIEEKRARKRRATGADTSK